MKKLYTYGLVLSLVHLTACGSITALTNTADEESALLNDVGSESKVETAFASLVESLNNNSGSASSDDVSAASGSGFQASAEEPTEGEEPPEDAPPPNEENEGHTEGSEGTGETSHHERKRIRCDNISAAQETFSCDNDTGTMSRHVEFTDCVVSNDRFEFTVNGGFTNSVANGGDGLCDLGFVNFASMVTGFEDLNASHSHTTDDGGMVRTFTTRDGHAASITDENTRIATFYDAIDSDEDGAAEEVTVEIQENNTITHQFGDKTRVVNVFSTNDGFAALDSEGQATTISTSLPLHALTFDADSGRVATRTILSGELITDSDFRLVYSVGDEGLLFDETDDSCGPESGTMLVTGYEILADGSIGAEIGSGSITFADGAIESASYGGASIDINPRPCK